MNKVDELTKKYVRVFKENFPLFLIPSAPESEIIKIIENCIKEGVPYKPNCKRDVKH